MIDAEERAAQQRAFFLKLSPQMGQHIAALIGGTAPPGPDGQEQEMKDSLELWFKMHNSGAMPLVSETAWWMTKYQDRAGRMTRLESNLRADELASFAVATVGMLMDRGVIKFTTEPEIPKLVTSGHDPHLHAVDKAILERLEATLKETDDE